MQKQIVILLSSYQEVCEKKKYRSHKLNMTVIDLIQDTYLFYILNIFVLYKILKISLSHIFLLEFLKRIR